MTPTHDSAPVTLSILHLEDRPEDCVLVQEAVRAAGLICQFTPVTTRNDFVAALMRGKFDLILAGYNLPDYDGMTALMQTGELQPDAPFIFVTGAIGEERAVEIIKEGAADCVMKTRLSRLGTAVQRALLATRERTERKQAEEALKASEARFREMAANIREVFWSASADGHRLHYISPAYEQVWDRPLAEVYDRPESRLDSIRLEDRPRVQRALASLAQGKSYIVEYRLVLADNQHRHIEERGYPVCNEEGGVERAVGVALDISDRKHLEEQLQQAQKMEVIGQLAGGIAHDFSNMLTVINGYSNLLLDDPALPPALAEPLHQIYVAGGRASVLTRQLLIFSRKRQAHSQSVDLNEVVTEAATMLRRMIGENIRLELDLAHPLPRTLADAGMIDQALVNLAVNARDAMPKGGSVVINTGSTELTAADCRHHPDARPGAYLWFSVRDTGCGIAPEVLPRIFEPFFTTKEAGKGTGLGLATVFGIARQHRGWVEVESEIGAGTMFRIFLPLAANASHNPFASGAETTPVQRGEETILLVEDEEPVRAYAKTVLQMHGYRVLEAVSVADALEVWQWHRNRIALLLTDLVLPDDVSGLELAERLQADRSDLKVLFSSGYNSDGAAARLSARQPLNFLHKPYQPKTLARMVREVIDHGTVITQTPSQAPFR
jgi:two-component system, cell cycle sensor histidine kinase and response regulator CckA